MAREGEQVVTCLISGSSVTTESQDCPESSEPKQEYFELLQRIPLSQSPEVSEVTSVTSDISERMISAILQLPQEITHHILYWLNPEDILSLRATSRTLHHLIHRSERDICLSLTDRIQRDCNFRLPKPGAAQNLLHFFEQYFLINAVCKVADLIANRISSFLKYKPFLEDQAALEVWRKQKYFHLRSHLRRAFYILQLYLDFISETVINEDQHFRYFTDEEFSSLHNIYDLDQQYFFAQHLDWLSEEEFIRVSCSLKIFKAFCKARKIPLTLSSRAYPFASVRQILFYRGLVPFAKLLVDDCDTVKQEMLLRDLATDLTGIEKRQMYDNIHVTPPLSSIHHLCLPETDTSSVQGMVRRNVGTRNEFFSNQDLWDKSGRAYMMRKLGRFPNLQSVTAWLSQTLESPRENKTDLIIGAWDRVSR